MRISHWSSDVCSSDLFYAMRMARAFTGRDKILKFEGAYHGSHDYSPYRIAPAAVSNYPAGQPDTAGIPSPVHGSVLVAPYNDLEAVRRIVAEHRAELAAVIVEPAQRVIFPAPDFLPGLRKICDENGVLLIFDEVVTGFRLAWGGAQEFFGVKPDLRSEEHTSELQSLMRISYAVFCLKKKKYLTLTIRKNVY